MNQFQVGDPVERIAGSYRDGHIPVGHAGEVIRMQVIEGLPGFSYVVDWEPVPRWGQQRLRYSELGTAWDPKASEIFQKITVDEWADELELL